MEGQHIQDWGNGWNDAMRGFVQRPDQSLDYYVGYADAMADADRPPAIH
ncbi:gp41 [Burkholderia phage Bcep781]|uniref:Gp41 n=1 Tax=Burkholderia phage Bcep781 TaxID=2883946 RepID=Q8HAL9_9CAUD|nr:gp41 [Burkholderia phage Bcep781]AAN38041.1 gp41 [Burkholderia phage Bcep781]